MTSERSGKFISSRLGFSVIINTIALFVSIVLFHPYWEEIDDIWIAAITEGAFGDNEPHVLFSNIIYGHILCLFQKIAPAMRWHAVFELFFIFLASVAFVYVLAKDNRGRLLSVVFVLGSFAEIYVAMQFSKIPAFIAMCGYMILFELRRDTDISLNGSRLLHLAAYLCLLYAMLLRPESFLLATMVAGIYGIVRVIFEIKNGEFAKNIKGYLKSFAPVAVMFIICILADRAGYTGPEWDKFRETWNLTENMIDYHHDALLYDKHGEELSSIGVSENDALLFITWQYGDDEFLNPDLLEKIIALDQKGLASVNIELLKSWVDNIHQTIFTVNPLILAFVMIIGVYTGRTLFRNGKAYNTTIIVTQAALALGVLFYYQYSSRWSHRIVYALILSQFILFIKLLSDEPDTDSSPAIKYAATAVLLFAIISSRLTNEFDYQEYLRRAFDHKAVISYMTDNKDKLFVTDTFTFQDYDRYNIFNAAQKGRFENMTLVGGSYTNSPMDKKITASYGYENPFKALEGRDENVVLTDNLYAERKRQYVEDHGDGGKYQLIDIGSVGGLQMYNIH